MTSFAGVAGIAAFTTRRFPFRHAQRSVLAQISRLTQIRQITVVQLDPRRPVRVHQFPGVERLIL